MKLVEINLYFCVYNLWLYKILYYTLKSLRLRYNEATACTKENCSKICISKIEILGFTKVLVIEESIRNLTSFCIKM